MPGESLLESFSSLGTEEKTSILAQMADMLACFQRFRLPQTIDKYGGVGFDESGGYISTALSIFKAGPFDTYGEFQKATIMSKLAQADRDTNVNGWRGGGIRERLDRFLADGLPVLQELSSSDRVLVHADFSIDNVLYDPSTKKITALFDFDFSRVSSMADEFFRSLGHNIGRFPSHRDDEPELLKLRDAMLHGFPALLPPDSDEVDWVAAKAWNDALRERDLQRPATVSAMDSLADVFWLSSQILPFKLCNEVVVGNSTQGQLKRKEEGEAKLNRFLVDYGY